ncbi:transcriptional regulator [Ameyamaea chiangmaiensis NBRC 103196]|uniref:SMP-30/gluconolactonase/LRE family protein n=1 Tax=Ameyamaea chiangmaiensis TaxID=442969 RepID=A0A850P8W6_9PROT|nr:SMP-30/gluconolactonase/LRE family protein [Ameyamaea chiangmaiensis]MBS4074031.1 SMP-30/gluconolactonase/LRE family protein [Ameyamaea chiangmaiensis]NVN39413.1 SMP-30/gluconolactonase/LRE family protein [Ameyamaea chiangmaiensis]GBQ67512.1 transcriptional regulator [Ameyamaea chiangmaiensis NBRC 103196]
MTASALSGAVSGPLVCAWDLKAELGEGPVWHEVEQALFFVDINGRAIHRLDPATGEKRSWTVPGRPGFVVPTPTRLLLCGMQDGLHWFDPATGTCDLDTVVEPERPGNRLNDGWVDPTGRLWFGTMHDAESEPTGSLYSVAHGADGKLHVVRHDEGYVVTNGPTVSPDGTTLYHNDSANQLIYAFDLRPDGQLANRRVFARLADGHPDGVVADSAGVLWVGTWQGGRVSRFAPDGTELEPLPIPARNVTKVAFGGADHRTLFITTARKDTDAATLAELPLTGGLFSIRVTTPGQAQAAFRLDRSIVL